MNLDHLSEHIIEKLLRDSTLSQRRISQINAHLAECRECRNIYKWLKSFYQELNRIETPTFVDRRLDRNTIGTIKLAPLHFEKPERSTRHSSMVLVAKSEEKTSQYEHVVTLASEEQHILVRVLHDNRRQTYRLFLITPEHLGRAHSIVELSSCQRALITDQAGKANFTLKKDPGSELWQDTRGILRMPLTRLKLDADDIRQFEEDRQLMLSDNGFKFDLTLQASQNPVRDPETPDTINIAIRRKPQKSNLLTKALLKDGDREQLLTFNDGMTSKIWERTDNELEILGYQ